jgi:hypothetical protein
MRCLLPLIASVLIAGCATSRPAVCTGDARPQVRDLLYFGTAIPGGTGTVSATDWDAFLRDTVTPRFPDGLTVLAANGQWRGADGVVVREPSYVLELLHPGEASAEREIAAIVQAYKTRFRQEAVMRVTSPACVSF